MKLAFILTAALFLTACQTTRPPVSSDGFCALGIFYVDEGAETRFTENEMRELVARNETTEELCGIAP